MHLEKFVAGGGDGHDQADALLELDLLQRGHVLLHQRAHPPIQLCDGRLRALGRACRDDAAVPAAASIFDVADLIIHPLHIQLAAGSLNLSIMQQLDACAMLLLARVQ